MLAIILVTLLYFLFGYSRKYLRAMILPLISFLYLDVRSLLSVHMTRQLILHYYFNRPSNTRILGLWINDVTRRLRTSSVTSMFLALSCSRAPLRQSLRPPWVLSAPHGSRRRVHTRRYATSTGTSSENLNVEHAAQISDSSTPEEISSNEAGGSKLADEIKEVGESSGIL